MEMAPREGDEAFPMLEDTEPVPQTLVKPSAAAGAAR